MPFNQPAPTGAQNRGGLKMNHKQNDDTGDSLLVMLVSIIMAFWPLVVIAVCVIGMTIWPEW